MADAAARKKKYWGWGYEDEGLEPRQEERLRKLVGSFFGELPPPLPAPVPVEALHLPDSRLPPPAGARFAFSGSAYERVLHSAGRSFKDLIRFRRGTVEHPPDLVLFPADLDQLLEALDWAARQDAAVIPFGGGTSVTGGVEPQTPPSFPGTVSLDLSRMKRVLEIDETSRLVHAEGGILGPDLDAALRPAGLSVRHYPQSYYFSTIGGWIATRSGGHYSTLLGKIESRVAALEVVTPTGQVGQTRRLPSSSIGPDPNGLWIGSEGLLGVITKAWLRVVALPRFKKTISVHFATFRQALDAARAIVQSGLYPAHLRILDPFEAMLSAAFSSGRLGQAVSVMILGFESAAHPVEPELERALGLLAPFGGAVAQTSGDRRADEDVEEWRSTFFRQPYLRDALVGWGLVADTFETAIPWDRAERFYEAVRGATLEALEQQCGAGAVLCRTTHAYPDGVALYFTFIGTGRPFAELEQWTAIKRAATDAVVNGGGTASHHHACGRDHAPWTARELPDVWRSAFLGARHALDPAGRMNPGVLFPR